MRRREFLKSAGFVLASGSAAAALGAESGAVPSAASIPGSAPLTPSCAGVPTIATADGPVPLPLVRAQPDRIISLTVCTRPFRAGGARIEAERLGRKTLVHNYGHGGSGWSLSWGSATLAVRHVLETGQREIAVIGCGVIGLTSALVAQRAGLKVRIYARELPPETRSTFATGNWSPNSRYCTEEGATPEVAQRWEEMARISFRTYQNLLGLPGDPIEWREGYFLSDLGTGVPHGQGEPSYAYLDRRLGDITPRSQELLPGTHPFPAQYVRRYTNMVFNISAYSRMLVADFQAAGGIIETREFEKPGDIARLREKTVINATGYGARALFGDESVVPVRGQLMRLIPQPEVTYGLACGDQLYMLPRRDGIILQSQAPGDFGNADTAPDRAAAERTVQAMADLNQRIRANTPCV
jgi:glycine/D-amino acid oxidase-like deaminating enzyme